jgi:hypothetical protein
MKDKRPVKKDARTGKAISGDFCALRFTQVGKAAPSGGWASQPK